MHRTVLMVGGEEMSDIQGAIDNLVKASKYINEGMSYIAATEVSLSSTDGYDEETEKATALNVKGTTILNELVKLRIALRIKENQGET